MGEGVHGTIVKGPVHTAVDAYVNASLDQARAFLAKVDAADTKDKYCDLLVSIGVTPTDADYLRFWWYGQGPDGFWPWLQPIFPILKKGLIKALRVMIATERPLDSYWSPAGFAAHVFIFQSPWQVTRLIVTPPTRTPRVKRTRDTPLWVVRPGSTSLNVGQFSSDASQDEQVEEVDGNLITWRMRTF